MDRKIEKRFWTAKRKFGSILVVVVAFLLMYIFIFADYSSRLYVKTERLSISEVQFGDFKDWIPTTGVVVPVKTVYLDAIEGGRVEELLTEEGSFVESGQPVVRLSNSNQLLDIMYREAEWFQQINDLRNTRLAMEQHRLQLRSTLVDLDYQSAKQKRQADRAQEMLQNNLISGEEFIQSKEEYEYVLARRDLTLQTYRQDSLFRQVQIQALEQSVERMQSNLEIVRQKLDNLTIRAPIAGQLTALNAEVGQSKSAGMRIGQIDVLDGFLVRCAIDEHYIARVRKEQTGMFTYVGREYQLQVTKVYPEVTDGRFEVDMAFTGEEPHGIRRGQSLRVQLELGNPAQAILLPRGGFYQSSGGRWVFVIDASGDFALRREIRLGRQNTEMFEVVDGLKPGEMVIISSYDNFGDVEKLILKKN